MMPMMKKMMMPVTSIALVAPLIFSTPDVAFGQREPGISQVDRITDDLHKITVSGAWEATVVVFNSPEGMLLVDSGFRGTTEVLTTALAELGDPTPTYLINTHSHKDHTGGNSYFGSNATVIAHEDLRGKLGVGSLVLEDYTEDAMPDIGVTEEMVLHFGGEEVVIRAIGGAHDNTDVIVFFRGAGVAYLGDLAYGLEYPSTDYFTGSLLRYGDVLTEIVEYLPAGTHIVSGHGRDHSYAELVEYRDMLVETQEIIANRYQDGLTVEEIVDAGFPEVAVREDALVGARGYVANTVRNLEALPLPTENILGALYEASKQGDGQEIQTEFRRIRRDESREYGLDLPHYENTVINYLFSLGRRLVTDSREADGLRVFEMLLEEYPDFSGKQILYDQMGEAQLSLYDFESARASFEKVLEFAPEHANALARLELLRGVNG